MSKNKLTLKNHRDINVVQYPFGYKIRVKIIRLSNNHSDVTFDVDKSLPQKEIDNKIIKILSKTEG